MRLLIITKMWLLCLMVGLAACRCFPENQLEDEMRRKYNRLRQLPLQQQQQHQQRHHQQHPYHDDDGRPSLCPLDHYGSQRSDRSLSPWKYVVVRRPELFPSSYVEARCLCRGCVINRTESFQFNSAPLTHSRLFVKRRPCGAGPDGTLTYSLETERVEVAVGCTCLRPSLSGL